MELIVVLVAVFVAAIAQRVTGMGFALMAAPPLIIATGPLTGVMLAIIAGGFSSLVMVGRVWRDIQWSRALALSGAAVLGIALGAVAAAQSPRALLQVVIGLVVLAALGMAPLLARRRPTSAGPAATGVAGFSSGVLNATAGLAGPPITIYAVLSRWSQREFAATLQPYFIITTVITLVMKLWVTPDAWPQLAPWAWGALLAAVVVGMLLGEWLGKRIPDHGARRAVIVIAVVGAIATIVDGLLSIGA